MSGFALTADYQVPIAPQDKDCIGLKEASITFKQLDPSIHEVNGRNYVACKFDTAVTTHLGVTVDEETGSWLFAVGTVLDPENQYHASCLLPLLKDYVRYGKKVFSRLDGAFALVLYDRVADKVLIVSDPLGFFSIFFSKKGSRSYISTSALAVAQVVGARLSEQGASQFLVSGSVYGRYTLWENIQRSTAGTVLEIDHTGITESIYFSLSANDEIRKLSLHDTVDQAIAVLSQSIQAFTTREGTAWMDLTGGFDSRLLASLFFKNGASFRAMCEGPVTSPDVRISSRISHEMGWEYRNVNLPGSWGKDRYNCLAQALGRGDGHYDVFKLSRVLWRQQEQSVSELRASVCGNAGGLWRGFFWKQEFFNAGRTKNVNYDRLIDYRILHPIDPTIFGNLKRIDLVRDELKSLLMAVGEQYAGSINTLKLDCIFAFRDIGHTGAHIAAVTGLQRVFAPYILKDTLQFAISTNSKWRSHSRMVRLMIEKLNPILANYETTSGGPASPMRLTNINKFAPYWVGIGKQLVRKVSHSILGHSILPPLRDELAGYPLVQWRRETLDCLEKDGILNPAQMRSGYLYDARRVGTFFNEAREDGFQRENLLSRVITVEMAIRAVESPHR